MPDDASQSIPSPPTAGLFVEFRTIEELFGTSYAFHLPWFQRAYAWGEEHAHRFLSDIIRALRNDRPRYVLGNIFLADHGASHRHTIVDGQQRCFTLTILFALLRHSAPGLDFSARLDKLIALPWDDDAFGAYRLAPQPSVADFLRDIIQAPGAIANEPGDFVASEVESNIIQNRNRLALLLDEFEADGGDLGELIDYLLTRCLVVLHVVDDEDEAWEMLRIQEVTGLPFHDAARTKITLIEAMPREAREAAAALWDQCQASLGNDGMQELTVHLRDLSGRQRSSQPIEKDIVTRFRLDQRGLDFMRDDVVPAANHLAALKVGNIGRDEDREAIAHAIRHLEWAGHNQWCVPALRWLGRHGGDHPDTARFFALLARKVWMQRICAADGVEHRRRAIALANEIADGAALDDMSEFDVVPQIRRRAYLNLTSRTFYDKRYCRPLLRFLSDLLGEDPGDIDGYRVTVEHVLPQRPRKASRWRKDFPRSEDVSAYAHRLGNLVFLSYDDNQTVANEDFDFKRDALIQSGFRLSLDAASEEAWTRETINRRTRHFADVIFKHWNIEPGPA